MDDRPFRLHRTAFVYVWRQLAMIYSHIEWLDLFEFARSNWKPLHFTQLYICLVTYIPYIYVYIWTLVSNWLKKRWMVDWGRRRRGNKANASHLGGVVEFWITVNWTPNYSIRPLEMNVCIYFSMIHIVWLDWIHNHVRAVDWLH